MCMEVCRRYRCSICPFLPQLLWAHSTSCVEIHDNSSFSDVDTAAKIMRWVHLYKFLVSFLDANSSLAVSHRKTCVSLVFRLRTVPADASMTIKFSWSVMVIRKLSADLICPWYHGITKYISSIYEPNYHDVELTPWHWSTLYTSWR